MSVIEEILVNGSPLRGRFQEQIIEGSLKLSARSVTSFDFTALDTPALELTGQAGQTFRDGTVIIWDDYILGLSEFETGGGTKSPTIQVSAISDFVQSLKKETGGKDWGSTDVSAWAIGTIRSKGAQPVVQPGLGERELERKEPEGNGSTDENTWDVLAEAAKQTGSWLFEYGNQIFLAKPSWLITRPYTRKYEIVWNSWTDHTDGLVAAPVYAWKEAAKEWEGKESLTIRVADPGPGSTNPMMQARPGDILNFTGRGNPTDDPTWLIVTVSHNLVPGRPVTITAWRAVDPPEILPKQDKGEGGDSAGVPTGPLGQHGWQGEQLKNAAEIVKEGQRRKLPTLALELAVLTAMGESSLRNLGYGDNAVNPDGTMNDSVGLFQQQERFDTGGRSRSDRLSPAKSAGIFYVALGKTPYQSTYNNGGPSVVHGGYYGPGKSGNSASLAVHNIQRNQVPTHYARWWADAQLVVKACIDAGKDSGGGSEPLTGPLAQKIESSMKRMEGKYIEFDGAFMYQCVDPVKQYVADLTGIRNAMGNGNQWWMNPALATTFNAIPVGRPPRKGDIVSWSGTHGAYPNGGVGHVAVYSHSVNGTDYYLSQNPGPTRIQPLSRSGVLGWMRPKG